jgi:uncharacterized protein YjeT (DUF2065 family)
MPASTFAVLIATTGVALAGLSVLILIAPRRALQALSRFGSTAVMHFGELSVRALIGIVFILGAPATRHPLAVAVVGGFLVFSALVLMILPRRWHAAYSSWWAARIPVWSVRVLALVSLVAGVALAWVVT